MICLQNIMYMYNAHKMLIRFARKFVALGIYGVCRIIQPKKSSYWPRTMEITHEQIIPDVQKQIDFANRILRCIDIPMVRVCHLIYLDIYSINCQSISHLRELFADSNNKFERSLLTNWEILYKRYGELGSEDEKNRMILDDSGFGMLILSSIIHLEINKNASYQFKPIDFIYNKIDFDCRGHYELIENVSMQTLNENKSEEIKLSSPETDIITFSLGEIKSLSLGCVRVDIRTQMRKKIFLIAFASTACREHRQNLSRVIQFICNCKVFCPRSNNKYFTTEHEYIVFVFNNHEVRITISWELVAL